MDKESAGSCFCTSTGIYRSPYPSLPPPSSSFPDFLFARSIPNPSKPAFIDTATGTSLSFSRLHRLSLIAADSLVQHGLRRGHVAILLSPNTLHFPVISLAVLSVGAVLSTANPLLTPQELHSQIQDSNPFLVLTTQELAPKFQSLSIAILLIIDDFIASLKDDVYINKNLKQASVAANDPALLFYSSGTTGKSKGVVSTHANLVAMAEALDHVWGDHTRIDHHEEVYGCVLPLFHMFGFSVFVLGTVVFNTTAVLVTGRFVPEAVMAAVEKYKVTRLPVVPPMVVRMARAAQQATREFDMGSLKEVFSSGASLSREHMDMFARRFPTTRIAQIYGLTETTGPVTLCDGADGMLHTSIGRLIPTMEAKIVDVENGEALPPNNNGELWLRGPAVMQGYMKNPEATALAITNEGWLRTGDLCYIDSQGLIYVVDRIKELIKYMGYQVAPAELEEVLSSHQEIHDVGVTWYPDEEAGEIPMACVVKKPRSEIKEDDIISFMANKVAPYKKVRKVVFLESIPRSPSGKILRRLLKSTAAAYDVKKQQLLSRL